MSRIRILSATAVMVAVLVPLSSSLVAAQDAPWRWPHRFDNIWIDTRGLDTYTALPGDRDLLIGLEGDDVLQAGDERDVVHGDRGRDSIDGGEGPDRLHGGSGGDSVNGGDGRDVVMGGPGDDTLAGGDGLDVILGGLGDDSILAADGGPDWVRCGPGADEYSADDVDRVARNCETRITVP